MRYFIDTEFIEGFHKPLFGKKRHFIDLVSIGIAAEDGRSYYAISNEYNYNDADEWVKKNVIIPMYLQEIHGDRRNHIDAMSFHKCIPRGKTVKTIAQEIVRFVMPSSEDGLATDFADYQRKFSNPEFYGYYADYDWVVFCSLFGTMMDLPKGFPMYCRDLKQILDEKCTRLKETAETIKELNGFPKQTNEHNALADAKWNKDLYEFLTP
jgi:hypothetical protein